MPPLPPLDFHALLRDPRMFDTKDTFRAAGFEVRKAHVHNIMVGRHPAAPNHLFKKYSRDVPPDRQQANYKSRMHGAEQLCRFIDAERLRHLVVPQKWIFDLPPSFARHGRSPHLLIVERLDIVDTKETENRYKHIDKGVLEELCRILHKFQGIDAAPHNVRFTKSGQIAFIDTENWERPLGNFFQYIRRELSESSQKFADQMFAKLSGSSPRTVPRRQSIDLMTTVRRAIKR